MHQPTTPDQARIVVSAVVIRDRLGRVLTVRKRGTRRFMLPGGKPEPGESEAQTTLREAYEELGVRLELDRLVLLGRFESAAANEAATVLESTVFEHPWLSAAAPTGEIAELRWQAVTEDPGDLAPMLIDDVLPALAARPPVVFLPGAGGRADFWRPVADRLSDLGPSWRTGYPGFGDEPTESSVQDLDGLGRWLQPRLPAGRCHVVAQSMGCVLALQLALQHREQVARLVLLAPSGGVDLAGTGVVDWRRDQLSAGTDPTWFVDDRTDLGDRLRDVDAPTLVLSAAHDPLSPPALGRRIAAGLRDAAHQQLDVGGHDVALTDPAAVAAAIRRHLVADPLRSFAGSSR